MAGLCAANHRDDARFRAAPVFYTERIELALDQALRAGFLETQLRMAMNLAPEIHDARKYLVLKANRHATLFRGGESAPSLEAIEQ